MVMTVKRNPIVIKDPNADEHRKPDLKQVKENAIREHAKFESDMKQYYIRTRREELELYDNDPKKDARKQEQLCKYCYYVSRHGFAGQAFTDALCIDCGKQMTFTTTSTDRLCPDCAKKHNLCKHCGGYMD